MTIPVYDYRHDIANVIVRPEIRSRFMRMEPGPANPLHSHDLGGEIFLVLEGQCEFIVEDEKVTCGPGQLVYMEPTVRHTLHAVGDQPCVVYLSVTPHVEPTHTRYDDAGETLPPVYGGWRGKAIRDADKIPGLVEQYATSIRSLAANANAIAEELDSSTSRLLESFASQDDLATKEAMDETWNRLRTLLAQVRVLEANWNALAPQGMPAANAER